MNLSNQQNKVSQTANKQQIILRICLIFCAIGTLGLSYIAVTSFKSYITEKMLIIFSVLWLIIVGFFISYDLYLDLKEKNS